MIKPGLFGKAVAANNRRMEFDFKNEQLLHLNQPIDILFIGDSITELWDMNAYLKTDAFFVNRGIGGDVSEYLLKRFDADCIQLKPKTCILMIGTNDITKTHFDPWWKEPGESEEKVLSDYKNNILKMVDKCDRAGIQLILCSVIPSDIAPPYEKEIRWKMTKEMNEFLQSLGKTYVDYHSVLTNDGKRIKAGYSLDGIHPNAVAYELMAQKLKEVVKL